MAVLDVRRVLWRAPGVEGFLRVFDRHQCVERQLRVVRTVLHVKSNQLGWVVAGNSKLLLMNRNNLRESDIAETAEIKDITANIIFQTCTPQNLIGKYLWILNTIIRGVESIH